MASSQWSKRRAVLTWFVICAAFWSGFLYLWSL